MRAAAGHSVYRLAFEADINVEALLHQVLASPPVATLAKLVAPEGNQIVLLCHDHCVLDAAGHFHNDNLFVAESVEAPRKVDVLLREIFGDFMTGLKVCVRAPGVEDAVIVDGDAVAGSAGDASDAAVS